MDLQEIENRLKRLVRGKVLCNESMKKHTSWRIGGPADIMVVPAEIDDIKNCLEFANKHEIPLTIMGNGTNMLVKDKGIRGIVLKVSRGLDKIQVNGVELIAQAGALIPRAAVRAAEAGLSGLEFAVGIPGSVGGAVSMNAGAHGKSMEHVVKEVRVLAPDGEILVLDKDTIGFRYRASSIKEKRMVVLEAVFSLEPGDKAEIKARNESNIAKRRKAQPLEFPNAGSVFANPEGQWAGWLIEQVGGKGMRVGDAVVSDKHANFIINAGNATAADVLKLIELIRNKVLEKFNIELNLEVWVAGE